MQSDTFIYYTALLKIGIYDYPSMLDLLVYMLPEIMIICCIMLNEIRLKLLGLYLEIEQDIEGVMQGIDRNMERGDEEKVKEKKMQASNMFMSRFFEPVSRQLENRRNFKEQLKQQVAEELKEESFAERKERFKTEDFDTQIEIEYKNQFPEESLADKQRREIKNISQSIWKASKKFDLDSNKSRSDFDKLIFQNVLQKSLESDQLIYVEGARRDVQPNFISAEEFQDELDKKENWDGISAGDHEREFEEQFEMLEERERPKLGIFERSEYFDKVFPSLKIQKPGYDLYGSSTILLSLTAVYVFFFYQNITVDMSIFPFLRGQSAIFGGEMAVVILVIIAIIILERYTNRTDTKAEEQKGLTSENDMDPTAKQGFFSQEEMFARASTARSMTVRLKTQKTSELDMQGEGAQDFLKMMYGGEEGSQNFDESRTKITNQQKCKFIMHWLILITSHLFIFWFLPIHGNWVLYGQPQCNMELEKYYGCKNFHQNIYLRIFYILIVLYLTISSLQLAYGFPIFKKPSSVMQYYGVLPNAGSLVFCAIPFAVEIRCVLDFTMSKTSLDVFQFWQLWQYHVELYNAKNGNEYYLTKKLGSQTDKLEKATTGCAISIGLLFLLVGPFLIFSEYGGLVQPNPVQSGGATISFLVNKTVYANATTGMLIPNLDAEAAEKMQELIDSGADSASTVHSSIPYEFYANEHGFLRTYDTERYEQSHFDNWAETRSFSADQIQDCVFSKFSDQQWKISNDNEEQLKKDLRKALNKP